MSWLSIYKSQHAKPLAFMPRSHGFFYIYIYIYIRLRSVLSEKLFSMSLRANVCRNISVAKIKTYFSLKYNNTKLLKLLNIIIKKKLKKKNLNIAFCFFLSIFFIYTSKKEKKTKERKRLCHMCNKPP